MNKRHRIFKFTWLHAHRGSRILRRVRECAYRGHRWFINSRFVGVVVVHSLIRIHIDRMTPNCIEEALLGKARVRDFRCWIVINVRSACIHDKLVQRRSFFAFSFACFDYRERVFLRLTRCTRDWNRWTEWNGTRTHTTRAPLRIRLELLVIKNIWAKRRNS